MRAQVLLAVLIGFGTSVAVSAEPVKAPAHKADQSIEKVAPVVVAAVGQAPIEIAKSDRKEEPQAAKPRRSRVTSCRCGDQTPNDN